MSPCPPVLPAPALVRDHAPRLSCRSLPFSPSAVALAVAHFPMLSPPVLPFPVLQRVNASWALVPRDWTSGERRSGPLQVWRSIPHSAAASPGSQPQPCRNGPRGQPLTDDSFPDCCPRPTLLSTRHHVERASLPPNPQQMLLLVALQPPASCPPPQQRPT